MPIEAVFFDVGNTIICPDPPVGEVYAAALRDEGVDADPAAVYEAFMTAWDRMSRRRRPGEPEYGKDEAFALDWWRQVVRRVTASFGEPADFERMFQRLWNHFLEGSAWRVHDDALPTVDALKAAGKGVGLISNWDVRLPRILDDLDLTPRFDWILISCLVGAEKPNPAIFRRALEQCALPPERTMHVGDSYGDDVLGALAAGMQAAWLRRDGSGEAQDRDVVVIRSLSEIVDLVG